MAGYVESPPLRAGLHTGEIEHRSRDLAGIAVHIANHIASLVEPSEILVSRTVVDHTTGSGLQYEPRGDHELIPGRSHTLCSRTRTSREGTPAR
jgi:class 3 adenylate cyclase